MDVFIPDFRNGNQTEAFLIALTHITTPTRRTIDYVGLSPRRTIDTPHQFLSDC